MRYEIDVNDFGIISWSKNGQHHISISLAIKWINGDRYWLKNSYEQEK